MRSLRRTARTVVFAVGKRVPHVLALARTTMTSLRSSQYRKLQGECPIEARTIVFEAYGGRGYSCSPRALYRALLERPDRDSFTFIWAFRARTAHALARHSLKVHGLRDDNPTVAFDPDAFEVAFGFDAMEELRHATIVEWGSREYYRSYARAAFWITNFILPAHLRPQDGQAYVQTWHGTPLKRLGCDLRPEATGNATFSVDEIHRRYSYEGSRLTYLVSPSAFTSEKLGSAFDLEALGKMSAVVEAGYPRNDTLHTPSAEKIAAIRARLGIPEGKRVILYAPTWRDNQHKSGVGFTYETEVDFNRLRAELGSEYVLLFRAHYLIANEFDFDAHTGFVIDASRVNDINDLYIAADILVTDYSSVFFDYANLRRPIVFYMYDLDAYADELRGFYLDLEELPGPIARNEADLIAAIRAADAPDDALVERYQAFHDRFNYLDDGHASERVLERVLREQATTSSE